MDPALEAQDNYLQARKVLAGLLGPQRCKVCEGQDFPSPFFSLRFAIFNMYQTHISQKGNIFLAKHQHSGIPAHG